MKFLYFLAAFTSLTSAVATAAAPSDAAARPPPLACKCAPIECPTSQPEQCECENQNAQSCADLCNTIYAPKKCGTLCGRRGLPLCDLPFTCIENPTNLDCHAYADCPGLCVLLDGPPCAGFAGLPCPDPNEYCVDDPRDTCAPPEGADCIGICVFLNGDSAAGGGITS